MKKIFTSISIIFITLISISASAQVKSYIALYGGLSMPQGDFAKSSYDNNQAGYAKRGVTFGLDGAVYVYKKLAVGATISFQDQGKLTYDDVYAIAAGYTSSFAADNSTVTAVNRYHNWNILVGPQYSFEFSKFIVDVRASAGIIKSISTPEFTTQVSGVPTQTNVFYQRSASATIFGYGGNLGLRYKLSDGFMIGIKGSYIDSQGLKITNDGRTSNVGRLVTKQPISEFQTTFGFTIAF
jgi:hypothetical protein